MNITCSHSRLRSALEACERIIARHLTLPILSNILLSAKKNTLTISSTNLEIGIVATITCKGEGDGELAVPAKVLHGIITNLTSDNVSLRSNTKHVLTIESGGYSGTIKGEKADDFPIIPRLKKETLFSFSGEECANSLASVVPFTAVSETRPELTGVLFYKDAKKEAIEFVAADGFRLAQKIIHKHNQQKKSEFSFIVPQRTVAEVVRICKESEQVEVMFDEKQIEFTMDGYRLVSRIIEGTYPNHSALIPQTFNTDITLDVEDAVKNIRLVSLLSSRINDIQLIGEVGKGVTFKTQDPDLGESTAFLEGSVEGEGVDISFNWRYLLEGLSNIKDKKARIQLIDSEKAALIQSPKNKDYLYVVMPLRT